MQIGVKTFEKPTRKWLEGCPDNVIGKRLRVLSLRELAPDRIELQIRALEPRVKSDGLISEEKARWKRDHSELMRLRNEVSILRNEAGSAQIRPEPGQSREPAPSESEPRFLLGPLIVPPGLPKPVQLSVSLESTVAVGGWVNESGQRVLALISSELNDQSSGEITLTTRIVDVPEEILARIPSGAANAGPGQMWHRVFSSTESDDLLRKLDQTSQ
jgi:hypothetical protein